MDMKQVIMLVVIVPLFVLCLSACGVTTQDAAEVGAGLALDVAIVGALI